MFPTWRLRLREARVAWKNGRYDEAGALLSSESLRDFLPAKQLAQDVAEKIVERAGLGFERGDSAAGWRDLQQADRLGGKMEAIGRLREQYAERVLREARAFVLAGQSGQAVVLLDKLQKRALVDERARVLRQIAQLMKEAQGMAARGHFAEASLATGQAMRVALAPFDFPIGKQQAGKSDTMDDIVMKLSDEQLRFGERATECQQLSAEMHAALAAENWSAALSAADAILAIAPRHAAAGQARRRAWKAVGMDVTQPYRGGRSLGARRQSARLPVSLQASRFSPRSTHASRSSEDDTVAGSQSPQRALLWIDAVGGFLVCTDDSVVLGQPSPGNSIAIPILADLSRRHAIIRRDAGAYVLEPLQRTSVNGRELTGAHVLADNDLIQLGDNVRLRFTKPHALSATARLVLESHHKTQPSADAVLLMADSCVLGPNRHCHVRCRDWKHDVVIYRHDSRVFCRADEPLTVDGVEAQGESEVESGVRVEGEEFSFSWESLM